MSQAESLLNNTSYGNGSTYATNSILEEHIIIDNKRIITVPEPLKRIAVQYDHNVETVTFDCPRYWDNNDLSAMYIYVNYLRSDKIRGKYLVKNITVDESNPNIIHFDWTIGSEVTLAKGNLAFLVCAVKADSEGIEELHWNSEINTEMYVSDGLECSEYVINEHPDIITDLLTRMDTVEEISNDTKIIAKNNEAVVRNNEQNVNDLIERMDGVIAAQSTIIDTSLSLHGYAADAKSTGDAINILNSELISVLNKKVFYFDNIASMKSSEKLKNGDAVKTLGYYSANDGGGAIYLIRNKVDEDVEDNGIIHFINDDLVAELITQNINSKQFGVIEGLDVTIPLQTLFNYSYNHQESDICLMGGNFIVSDTININPYCKIKLIGDIVITDNNENNITFNIQSDVNETNKDTQLCEYLFDNSNGSLTLINNKRDLTKTAIKITSVETSTAKRINPDIKGLNIRYYDIGISLDTFNTYLMNFEKCIFAFCNVGMFIGENAAVDNSGENISMSKCLFTRNLCAIRTDTSIKFDIDQTSFDFNALVFYLNAVTIYLDCTKCWFEGMGSNNSSTPTYYKERNGLIFSNSNESWYAKINVTIENSMIAYLSDVEYPKTMIQGKSLTLYLNENTFWYSIDTWNKHTLGIDGFTKQFLCDDNVRHIYQRNNKYKLNCLPMIQSKLSSVDSYFSSIDVGTDYITFDNLASKDLGDYEVVEVGTTSTNFRIQTVEDKKCIELTPPFSGAESKLILTTKKYLKLIGDKFTGIGFMKGYKGDHHTALNIAVNIYDKDLNLISTLDDSMTSFISRGQYTDGVNPDDWISTFNIQNNNYNVANNKLVNYVIPPEAVYYKPVFTLRALNGSMSDTDINGVTKHATDPVYFTGLHFYNYN